MSVPIDCSVFVSNCIYVLYYILHKYYTLLQMELKSGSRAIIKGTAWCAHMSACHSSDNMHGRTDQFAGCILESPSESVTLKHAERYLRSDSRMLWCRWKQDLMQECPETKQQGVTSPLRKWLIPSVNIVNKFMVSISRFKSSSIQHDVHLVN